MAMGSTQPLVKMSTRNIPGAKGCQCIRLTTYRHTVPLSRNLGALTSQNPLGLLRPVMEQFLQHLKKCVRFSSSSGTGKMDPNFLGPTEIVCFYCRYDRLKRMDTSKSLVHPIVTYHSHQPCTET